MIRRRPASDPVDLVAADAEQVVVDVDLTDEHGMPRCARLRPPAIRIA